MKKLLWLIVCLMTMVMVSCSNDSEEVSKDEMIVGGWEYNEDYYKTEYWFYDNGTARLIVYYGDYLDYELLMRYSVSGNRLTFYDNLNNSSADVEYWKRKIEELEKKLETARGAARQNIIDLLNEYINKLRKEQARAKNGFLQLVIVSISRDKMTLESLDRTELAEFKRIR